MDSRALVAALATFAAAGCCALGPPPPSLEDVLPRAAAAPSWARRTARAELESNELRGQFQAVLLEERSEAPRVRLQLLPELGGKVLDVAAVAGGEVVGYWPHLGRGFQGPLEGAGALPMGFHAFLAVSLLEGAAPLTLDRVQAGRETEDGYELQVRPAAGGDACVRVWTDAEGTVLRRAYAYGGVTWREELAPRHELTSRGFRCTLLDERVETLDAAPAAVFELALPEGVER